MKILKGYSRLLDVIEWSIKVVLVLFLGAMCLIAFVEVFRRYLFKSSFTWADELCRYLMVWVTSLGATLLFRKRRLVKFDFGHDKLPPRFLAAMTLVAHLTAMSFVGFLFIRSWKFNFSKVMMNQHSIGTSLPMAVIYFVVPLCFGLMILYGIEQIPELIGKTMKKEDGRL